MTEDSRKLFEKTVKRGHQIEKETRELVSETNKRISNQSLDLEKISTQFNDSLNEIRKKFSDKLGLPQPVTRADLERLEKKVNALTRKVAALEKAGKLADSTPRKRTPTPKRASKKPGT